MLLNVSALVRHPPVNAEVMDWDAIRKLRKSRVYDVQSFKLHKPLPRMTAHRAVKALRDIEATKNAVVEDGSQFKRPVLAMEIVD